MIAPSCGLLRHSHVAQLLCLTPADQRPPEDQAGPRWHSHPNHWWQVQAEASQWEFWPLSWQNRWRGACGSLGGEHPGCDGQLSRILFSISVLLVMEKHPFGSPQLVSWNKHAPETTAHVLQAAAPDQRPGPGPEGESEGSRVWGVLWRCRDRWRTRRAETLPVHLHTVLQHAGHPGRALRHGGRRPARWYSGGL